MVTEVNVCVCIAGVQYFAFVSARACKKKKKKDEISIRYSMYNELLQGWGKYLYDNTTVVQVVTLHVSFFFFKRIITFTFLRTICQFVENCSM